MSKKVNALVLRVNEENGKIEEYQKSLFEAAVLGLDNVIFIYEKEILEDASSKIDDMKEKLYEMCNVLEMTYYESDFIHYGIIGENTVGSVDDKGRICSFNIALFDEYKSEDKNKQKLLEKANLFETLVNNKQVKDSTEN